MTGVPHFKPDDVPDLAGKVAIVTGGNRSLGLETVYLLLRRNCTVHIAGRSQSGYDEAVKTLSSRPDITTEMVSHLHFLPLDLASMKNAQLAAESFIKSSPSRLDIVICNAGISLQPGYILSEEGGYDTMFNTNHLGHFAFVGPLLPLLEKTAKEAGEARVVITSSEAHKFASDGIDFDSLTKPSGGPNDGIKALKPAFKRYGVSKLSNLLYAKELDRRWAEGLRASGVNVRVNSAHPGTIADTNLGGSGEEFGIPSIIAKGVRQGTKLFGIPQQEGAMTQVFVATHPSIREEDLHSLYFMPKLNWRGHYVSSAPSKPSSQWANDDELAKRLWDYSEEALNKALAIAEGHTADKPAEPTAAAGEAKAGEHSESK